MEPTDYIPIDCGQYSEYELAIMHDERLRLSWRDPGDNINIGIVTPIDLRTRSGEEFLVVRERDGEPFTIRLDRILQFSRV
jgi:transcriptional antiterminator Rof (Rho-off)